MKEIWKDIENYEGLYQVSNLGNVYSHYSNRLLNPFTNTYGYLRVMLTKNGHAMNVAIHRLVGNHFIPNLNELPQINHKDEDKSNNHVSNLEWCTNKYNNSYGTKVERTSTSNRNRKKVQIGRYSLEGELLQVYNGYREVEEGGYSISPVWGCCNNKKYHNTHKGFKWKLLKNT